MTFSFGPGRSFADFALDEFIHRPVTSSIVEYLAGQAALVVRCQDTVLASSSSTLISTPPTTLPQHTNNASRSTIPSLRLFIQSLVNNLSVQLPILMTALVYIARLRPRLPPDARGTRCTAHRIVLASLIVAAKALNDGCIKNKRWSKCTAIKGYKGFGFVLPEVNLMERQLLFLLDWNIGVSEDDLLEHFEIFLAPIRVQLQLQLQFEHEHHVSQLQQRLWTRGSLVSSQRNNKIGNRVPHGPSRLRIDRLYTPSAVVVDAEHTNHSITVTPSSAYAKRKPREDRDASVRSTTVSNLALPAKHPPPSLASSRSSSLASSSRSASAAPSKCSTPVTAPTMLNYYSRESVMLAIADQSLSPGIDQQAAYCGQDHQHIVAEAMLRLPKSGTNGRQYSLPAQTQPPAKKRKCSDVEHLSSNTGVKHDEQILG